jgi:hypothetical protein
MVLLFASHMSVICLLTALQLSSADLPFFWHLKNPGVFRATVLYPHNVMHSSLRDYLWVAWHCPTFPGFTICVEASITHILHTCQTSITQMIPRSAASLSSSWATLNHSCCGLWVPGWLNMENHLISSTLQEGYHGDIMSKQSKLKWVLSCTFLHQF